MRLLVDTVTFLWATGSPEQLSPTAAKVLAPESSILELSTISLCEIAIKHSKGKLKVNEQAVQTGLKDFEVRILPYAAAHAYRMFGLPLHHSDPFDRMIIAQALAEQIPIVTSDSKFRLYQGLEVIW